ncbi:hypothetical protein GCM10023335_07880 [Streptomyces siamensis]|uniref:Restriction endonuclease n=1 Tax=Streptomyces siamensis TaxID=1274986 RepID=A0ABP9IGH0_9ACTN
MAEKLLPAIDVAQDTGWTAPEQTTIRVSTQRCPISGRILADRFPVPQDHRVHDELVDHLTRSTPLNRGEALRVVQDVLAYFDETTEEYVRRRHRELQGQGLVNASIFERIEADLKYRAVAPPELTLRQLRRIVYG